MSVDERLMNEEELARVIEKERLVKLVEDSVRFPELIDIMTWATIEICETAGVTHFNIKPKSNQTRVYRRMMQSVLDLSSYRREVEFYWEDGCFVVILAVKNV